jgi:exonuclease SbcC
MKINKAILHNIQKHEHLVVEFDKNLTAITGESDRGKSSILRALGWVLFNKPSSNELRRKVNDEYTDESYVILYVTKDGEDHFIERYVSDKLNLYKLDGLEFRSFKRDVPEPIAKLVNLDYRINVQKQFDSPFLLGDTSGEIARMFNELLGLEEANDLLELINKDLLHDKKEKESVERQLEENNELIKILEGSAQLDLLADQIESEYQTIEEYESRLHSIITLVSRIERTDDELRKSRDIRFNGESIAEEIKKFKEKENHYTKTKKLIDGISRIPDINISFSTDNLTLDYNYFKKIDLLLETLEDARYNINRCDTALVSYNKKLDELNKELSSIKICPTCKRPME